MSDSDIKFIKDKLMLIALENITEEIQEEKVEFIVNGIKNAINNKIADEDIIVAYYDILKDLRMVDIRKLINLYKDSKKTVLMYEIDNSNRRMNSYEAVEAHVIRKLESICLVTVNRTINDMGGNFSRITPDKVRITVLGINFVEFFYMEQYES